MSAPYLFQLRRSLFHYPPINLDSACHPIWLSDWIHHGGPQNRWFYRSILLDPVWGSEAPSCSGHIGHTRRWAVDQAVGILTDNLVPCPKSAAGTSWGRSWLMFGRGLLDSVNGSSCWFLTDTSLKRGCEPGFAYKSPRSSIMFWVLRLRNRSGWL